VISFNLLAQKESNKELQRKVEGWC